MYFLKNKFVLILLLVLSVSKCSEPVILEWENGEIPYYFSGEFTLTEIQTIHDAMHMWESVCGVIFIEVTPRSSAYEIRKTGYNNEWASTIGENNVQCYMYFGKGTTSDQYGHTLHELGHCIGFLHEHQRVDRDLYIIIHWENIWPEYKFNFSAENNPLIKESSYPYDFDSIMHYPEYGFSITGYPTIEPRDGSITIGQRTTLSPYDIQKAVDVYGLPVSAE
jgi:Astacin (Peptidase family M12A)